MIQDKFVKTSSDFTDVTALKDINLWQMDPVSVHTSIFEKKTALYLSCFKLFCFIYVSFNIRSKV